MLKQFSLFFQILIAKLIVYSFGKDSMLLVCIYLSNNKKDRMKIGLSCNEWMDR